MSRKYPIGLQSFRKIREENYLYIDKTEIVHRLVTTGSYYFLSRPRRFGKSLLVDTLEELFKGGQSLFKGLWIEDRWDWSQSNPVIHFNFAELPYKEVGLGEAISRELIYHGEAHGINLTGDNIKDQFRELIVKVAEKKGKLVILIDEYDKPLIDFLHDKELLENNRSILKSFYSVLKSRDAEIRFLLLTGVSRFSKVSLFSDLNHLEDITIGKQFNALVGITQQELERDFATEIASFSKKDPRILEKTKNWYNGYTWGGEQTVYNPFSLLNFMKTGEFQNYWFQTGTPAFFYDMIEKNPLLEFPEGPTETGIEGLIDLFDQRTVYGGPGSIEPVTIMFQTGYLTIKDYIPEAQLYILDYPNQEVRQSTQLFLLSAYSHEASTKIRPNVLHIARAFQNHDIDLVMRLLDTLFVHIPNTLWTGATERFYHAIVQNTFSLLDIFMESERNYAGIRPDITVFTQTHIYVLEFKLDKPAKVALDQLLDRNYFRPFQNDNRKKVAIGISFSSEKRAVDDFMVQELSSNI